MSEATIEMLIDLSSAWQFQLGAVMLMYTPLIGVYVWGEWYVKRAVQE